MPKYPEAEFAQAVREAVIRHKQKTITIFDYLDPKRQEDAIAYVDGTGDAKPIMIDALKTLFKDPSGESNNVVSGGSRSTYKYDPTEYNGCLIGASGAGANEINIVYMGEDHDSKKDRMRGTIVAGRVERKMFAADLIIKERGFGSNKYAFSSDENVASEDRFSGGIKKGWDPVTRSVVTAGYLFACLASEHRPSRIILFFGERHVDIFDYLDEFANLLSYAGVAGLNRRVFIISSFKNIDPSTELRFYEIDAEDEESEIGSLF